MLQKTILLYNTHIEIVLLAQIRKVIKIFSSISFVFAIFKNITINWIKYENAKQNYQILYNIYFYSISLQFYKRKNERTTKSWVELV